jgi:hypothetical protein
MTKEITKLKPSAIPYKFSDKDQPSTSGDNVTLNLS